MDQNIFLTNTFVKHFLTFPFRSTVDRNFDKPFLLIWMTSLVVVYGMYNCVCRVNSAELRVMTLHQLTLAINTFLYTLQSTVFSTLYGVLYITLLYN